MLKISLHGNSGLTPGMAALLGYVRFDGSLIYNPQKHSYYVMYYSINQHQAMFVADLLQREFNISAKTVKVRNYFQVVLYSKLVCEQILKYGEMGSDRWQVPTEIVAAAAEIQIPFLRALFDDESTVENCYSKKRSVRRIKAYSINQSGLSQIQQMLSNLGIETKLGGPFWTSKVSRNPIYFLVVGKRQALERFEKLIGYNHPEKRDRLLLLINSYRKAGHGQTKERILTLLKQKPSTVTELVNVLDLAGSTVQYHLIDLQNRNKVSIVAKKRKQNIWRAM